MSLSFRYDDMRILKAVSALHSRHYVLNSILINVYFLYMFSPYYITLYLLIYYYYRTTNDNEEEKLNLLE